MTASWRILGTSLLIWRGSFRRRNRMRRPERRRRDDAVGWEADACKAEGIAYQRIPSDAANVEPAKIKEFLQTIRAAARPVYVHCRQGRDRTGLELAVYRIVDEGWTKQRAMDELY